MIQIDRHLGFRHAVVWLACAAVLSAASAARAVNIVDVRVGTHPDHTRIVIELDEPSPHQVTRSPNADGDLAVRVEAVGAQRRVDSRSPLVEAVTLEPEGGIAVARISLREPGLEYSELVLASPPRIVIDVRRAATAATKAAAPAEDGPDWRRDPFAPPASYAELVAAQQAAAAAERGGRKDVAAPAAKPPEAAHTKTKGPSPREEAPAAAVEGVGTPVAVATPPPVTAAAPTPNVPPTSPPAANPRVLAAPPASSGLPPAPESTLGALRGRIVGLGPVLPLIALGALVLIWIVYRRLIARQTRARALGAEEEEAPVFHDEFASFRQPIELRDEPEIAPLVEIEAAPLIEARPMPEVEVPQHAEAEEFEPGLAAQEIDAAHAALADSSETAETEPATREEEPVVVIPEETAIGWRTLPIQSAPLDQPEPVEEPLPAVIDLERRIAVLEGRIEELVESRLRLERFAAAQNEELRVQRAAIARTQRVLRGIVKPDDPGAESSPSTSVPAPPRSV